MSKFASELYVEFYYLMSIICACGSQVASADKFYNKLLLTKTNEYIEREFARLFIESVRMMGWGGTRLLFFACKKFF